MELHITRRTNRIRSPRPRKRNSLNRYMRGVGFLFILPWLLGFVLLKAFPILAALGFSFTNFRMLQPDQTQFIGIQNYITFFRDPRAGSSLFRSITYFVTTVPIEMVVALGLAALFSSERLRATRILRTLYFMPSIIPAIAISIVVSGLLNPNSGWLNQLILKPLDLPSLPGRGNFFQIVLALWTVGPGFLIMLSAMLNVPKEIYEAARVDGAGPAARFFSITFPMISPAVFFSLVINMISSFGGVALLDRGLPYSRSLSPMESYISSQLFTGSYNLGYASALAWMMFIVVMVITLALFYSTRYWVHFPEEDDNEEI
ncbi:MAG TPA: sugar ABC transporter permease [Anaerolineales bacterium]|nr:sugar ABC transporter permease [Anaerolineales bacterium]